jgi:hypothetical protein
MSWDLQRIASLPIDRWQDATDLDDAIRLLTSYCRAPGGTQTLWPLQAAALAQIADGASVVVTEKPGAGKTLIATLAPVVSGRSRPLILCPASLRRPMLEALASPHWHSVPTEVVSYEMLSRESHAEYLLRTYTPDMLIADEAHYMSDPRGARWSRVRRLLKEHPDTQLVLMTGTPFSRSVLDSAHLFSAALNEGSPFPTTYLDLQEWRCALDTKLPPDMSARHPGRLLHIMPAEPGDELVTDPHDLARMRVGRRVVATRGVIASGSDMPDIPLHITVVPAPTSDEVQRLKVEMMRTWETPCGQPFETPLDLSRHLHELTLGYYRRWVTPPPTPWLVVRRQWSGLLRRVLGSSRRRWDTPLQIANAIDRGECEGADVLRTWREIQPTYDPVTEPVWVCDQAVQRAAQWLTSRRGICWTQYRPFGERVAQTASVPYYRGPEIERERGSCVASISSCGRGLNLQYHHHCNLLPTCPPSNKIVEQLLARTHRPGQTESEVTVELWQSSDIAEARAGALAAQQITRTPQRLLCAQWYDER